jgi:hypothetical protein
MTDVLVVDPYFSADDVDVLAEIPNESSVLVVTSGLARGIGSIALDVGQLADVYSTAWRTRFKFDPPRTSIAVMSTASGRSPIHDRFAIAGEAGLRLGTSVGGLGYRLSEMSALSPDEVAERRAVLSQLLGAPFPTFQGERIEIVRLMLE